MLYAAGLVYRISRAPALPDDKGDPERKKMAETMDKLQKAIADGATAFLQREYLPLSIVVALLFILIAAAVHWQTAIWYIQPMCLDYSNLLQLPLRCFYVCFVRFHWYENRYLFKRPHSHRC